LLELRPRPIRSKLAYRRALGRGRSKSDSAEKKFRPPPPNLNGHDQEEHEITKNERSKLKAVFRLFPFRDFVFLFVCPGAYRGALPSIATRLQVPVRQFELAGGGGRAARKSKTPVSYFPSANSLAWREWGVQSRYVVCVCVCVCKTRRRRAIHFLKRLTRGSGAGEPGYVSAPS